MRHLFTERNRQHAGMIIIGGIGGWLMALTNLSAGWMVGALMASAVMTFWKPHWFQAKQRGLPRFWQNAGQLLLAIELGKQVNRSIWLTLFDNGLIIIIALIVSFGVSLCCGWVLWRYSRTDLLTGLFASTPGGMSTMPNLADEMGANPIVVGMVQLIRLFLVVSVVPLLAFAYVGHPSVNVLSARTDTGSFWVTIVLAGAAWIAAIAGKQLKFPAPWLTGGMLGTAFAQRPSPSGSDMICIPGGQTRFSIQPRY